MINQFLIIAFLSLIFTDHIQAQPNQIEKMKQLDDMIGDWVGVSQQIKDDTIEKEVPAYESIKYGLDSHIIIIDLKSETLVLHTIIQYDEEDETYYYHPFSKNGTGKYPAHFEDGKLIVVPKETVRYVFTLSEDGNFTEYGERLIDNKWVRYFQDVFTLIE